jgi:excisionase family DNA binding protein
MTEPAAARRGLAARRPTFTSSQAASYVGVSQSAIRRWSDSGHLGSHRTPGGQRRFSREQLDRFIASLQGEAAPGAERSAAA